MTDNITLFDPAIETALREEASAARLRLGENTNLADLHARLAAKGNKLVLTENGLQVEGATQISAKDLLIQASKDADTRDAFVVAGSKLTALSQLSSDPAEALRQKIEFVRKFGQEEFARLSLAAAKFRPNVVVSTGMSREDWLSLSRTERTQAINLWGNGASGIVGKIMSRRSK